LHFVRQSQNSLRGRFRRNATGVDVGDEIALGIGVPGARPISEIRRQALGRGQSGPLADEQHNYRRTEDLADIVQDANAAIADHKRLTKTPATVGSVFFKERQETRDLGRDGRCGQTVSNHDLDVRPGRTLSR
jgi:hypothetical protein